MADPGELPPTALFLDQTEARRAGNNFLETAPPPLPHLRVWMTGPLPYLKVWIRHCGMKAISNPFPLLCLYTKVTKIHTVLFATVWQNNYIVPLTKPK